MNINQTLEEYVIKEINHHLENSGESLSKFCKRCKIQDVQMKAFIAGASSVRLCTADKILRTIRNYKND